MLPPAGGLSLLPRAFCLRPAVELARDLLGRHLAHGEVILRITEVEAYGGPEDSASHARFGRRRINASMFEEGGLAYVFFCYGMHHMLNVVAGPQGLGSAVLIRSCEPVSGLDLVRSRRGLREGRPDPLLLTGPGKVTQALGLDRTFDGHPLFEPGGLELREGVPPAGILAGPRIGIGYAREEDRLAPLRFAAAGTPWVSHLRAFPPPWGGTHGPGRAGPRPDPAPGRAWPEAPPRGQGAGDPLRSGGS